MQEKHPEKKTGGKKRAFLGLTAAVPFGVLLYFCKFVLPGYSFTALVCLGVILLILFYTFIPMVGVRYPVPARWATVCVTTVLCFGLLAAGITEFLILKASFQKPKEPVDYVVVLGAKVRVTGPSASLWDRINGAYAYLSEHPETVAVVSGGQGDDEHMTEAQSMFDELTAMGISPDRIWLEEKSTTTRENLLFSLDVIEAKTGERPGKIGVVSSEYHMLRAGMTARTCGVEFVGIPAKTSRLGQLLNHCMREIPAVWKYAISGGRGND